MPKITAHGGASFAPPTEEQYTRAMDRHGTPEWTQEDAELVKRYHQLREDQAAEAEVYEETKETREDAWDGNSSSESESKQQTTPEQSEANPPQPAPMTENPSDKDQEESSSAFLTGGSTHVTSSRKNKK